MDRKKCFNFEHKIEDNLNVAYNKRKCILAFWNKYQICLLDVQELDALGYRPNWLFYNTEFEIDQLILAEHLLCLDNEGNLFIDSHRLQQTATVQNGPEHNFLKLESNILRIEWYEDLLFSILLEKDELCLKIDKIKSTDNVFKTLKLYSKNRIENYNLPHLPNEIKRGKCILNCYRLNEDIDDGIKQIFKKKKSLSCQQFIIIMSLDKLTLYSVLVDLEFRKAILEPVKLLSCPSEINSVVVIKEIFLYLIISLNSGTVIKQSLNNNFNTPNIAHLNTAIHKLTVVKDKIIYTDGMTMWVSTNTFTEPDAKLRQLFVKNIKDFIQISRDGKIICTTYSKQVYKFNVNDESSYLFPIAASEYYPAEHLSNNMNYLNRIMEEVEKNDEIIKNIKKEENFITILALSYRQDIMHEMIQYSIQVYEYYEDILKEGLVLNLTNNFKDYFDGDSFYFLIKMFATIQQNFDDVLANIFTDSKIHVTILSEQKIIKSICIKVFNQLKILNILVPLRMNNLNTIDLKFDIKIVKKIPKVLNGKENLWTTLYCKQVTLTPEHFIKTNPCLGNVRLLKDPVDSMSNVLYKTSYKHYGHLFRITKEAEDLLKWSFFIKLPNMYKEHLQNEIFYKEHFNSTKAKFLLREISSEDFLNSRKIISFLVAHEKVNIEIINDGFSGTLSSNMIKVSCANPLLALGIRNFFSNLTHNNFLRYQPGQEFFNSFKIISSLKKIETAVEKCVNEKKPFDEFFKIFEQYQLSLCETLV